MDKHFEDIFEQYKRLILSRRIMGVVTVAILINMITIMINRCLGCDNMFLLSIQALTNFITVIGIIMFVVLHYKICPGFSKLNALLAILTLASITGWSFLFVENLRALIALN